MDERLEQVPGFGRCGLCLYNTSGPAELCFACARRTMEPLAPRRCLVCDRPYAAGETTCGNPLCNRSCGDQRTRIRAVPARGIRRVIVAGV